MIYTIDLTQEQLEQIVTQRALSFRVSDSNLDPFNLISEEITKENIDRIVSSILNSYGGKSHLRGYPYIQYAINLVYFSPTKLAATKDIYPRVAKQFNTTPQKVERCMRTWMEGSNIPNKFKMYEFLCYFVERLKYS